MPAQGLLGHVGLGLHMAPSPQRMLACLGGIFGKQLSCLAHLCPPSLGPLLRVAQPPAPSLLLCQLGPTAAWLSGCHSVVSPAAWDPVGMGLGRHLQPVQVPASGPGVTQALWF